MAGNSHAVRRYGFVLVLLAATFTFGMVQPATDWALAVAATLQGAAVLGALSRAGVPRGLVALALILIVLSVGAATSPPHSNAILAGVSNLAAAALLLLVPVAIVIEFRRDFTVTPQSVAAAVCVYIVMGMVFANLGAAISAFSGQPYFAGKASADRSDYLYFSFITLATVGYGDFVAALKVGRALAVLEGLMGQLYLVTVVALVVSRLGFRR